MSLYGLLKRPGPSGFGYNSTAEQVTEGLDLSGKVYLITGCNSGIGAEAFRVLAKRGATVLGAARSLEKAQAACDAVQGDTRPVACELSEPDSVRRAVEAVQGMGLALDGLIANAGIMALPERTLHHGVELQLLTNHVGHFILVTGLLDQLSPTGRVVMLSSTAHQMTWPEGVRVDDFAAARGYNSWRAYGQSKLCNLLFAKELARRLPAGQTANALHPGVIATNLGRHMPAAVDALYRALGPVFATKTVPQGAATETYAATHPSVAGVTGAYLADCNLATPSAHGQDMALAASVWEATEALVATL
ncbi:MAG: SDR family NAD(P)-dependent oxidoreductase [Alphaproteobacteria bacterium]|nr:SDR family NAD(P)-dependent oxidoreductase [Alphaproteobacteria bacterium]MCB9792207.1 SDR family NAD(P)-dependent oxidoreductase [Alphaproteobacteria bacterium]